MNKCHSVLNLISSCTGKSLIIGLLAACLPSLHAQTSPPSLSSFEFNARAGLFHTFSIPDRQGHSRDARTRTEYTAVGLPDGLEILNTSLRRAIHGWVQAEPGTYEVELKAVNAAGEDTATGIVHVLPGIAPEFQHDHFEYTFPVGTDLTYYVNTSAIVGTKNYTAPLAIVEVEGELPPGLVAVDGTLDGPEIARIIGVAEKEGRYEFLVRVWNSFGYDESTWGLTVVELQLPEFYESSVSHFSTAGNPVVIEIPVKNPQNVRPGSSFTVDSDAPRNSIRPRYDIAEGKFIIDINESAGPKGDFVFKWIYDEDTYSEIEVSWEVVDETIPELSQPSWFFSSQVGQPVDSVAMIPLSTEDDIEFPEITVSTEDELPPGVEIAGVQSKYLMFSGNPEESGSWTTTVTIDYGYDTIDAVVHWRVGDPATRFSLIFGDRVFPAGLDTYYSDWFGFVYAGNYPWAYHYEFGWIYMLEDTLEDDAIWFYNEGAEGRGWMFGGRDLEGFFFFQNIEGEWAWEWLNSGVI